MLYLTEGFLKLIIGDMSLLFYKNRGGDVYGTYSFINHASYSNIRSNNDYSYYKSNYSNTKISTSNN
mgnify:CR=1 FL=1